MTTRASAGWTNARTVAGALAGFSARRALASPAFWVATALLALFAAAMTLLSVRDLAARDQDYRRLLQAQVQAELDTRAFMGWEREPALRVIRPPSPGGVLVRGMKDAVPAYWDFGPSGVTWGREYAGSLDIDVGALPDVTSLVLLPFGLFAIVIATESVAAARVNGLLRAWLRLPVSPTVVIAGLLTGSAIALAVVAIVVLGSIVGVAALAAPPGLSLREVGARAIALSLPFGLFTAFMTASGGAVASMVRTEGRSYLTATALWMVLCPLGPQLIAFLVAAVWPLEIRSLIEERRDETHAMDLRAAEFALGGILRGLAGDDHDLPTVLAAHRATFDREWQTRAREAWIRAAAEDTRWQEAQRRHAMVLGNVGLASPALQLARSFAAIAGTDQHLETRWSDAVSRYQQQLREALFNDQPRVTVRVPREEGHQVLAFDRRRPPQLQDLPRFSPPVVHAGDRLRAAVAPTFVLAGYAALAIVAAVVAFRRRSVA